MAHSLVARCEGGAAEHAVRSARFEHVGSASPADEWIALIGSDGRWRPDERCCQVASSLAYQSDGASASHLAASFEALESKLNWKLD